MPKIITFPKFKKKGNDRENNGSGQAYGLFSEAVINAVPVHVIRTLILLLLASLALGMKLVGIFPDPIVNKVLAVLVIMGAAVLYLGLLPLYWTEKKFRWMSKFFRKPTKRVASSRK